MLEDARVLVMVSGRVSETWKSIVVYIDEMSPVRQDLSSSSCNIASDL